MHNKEAEEAVLGSVLIDPELFISLRSAVSKNDFYIHKHQWVWNAIGILNDTGVAIDAMTVSNELDRMGEDYGGTSWLFSLVGSVVSSLNAMDYARIVADHAKRRRLEEMATDIVNLAHSNKPIQEIMTLAQTTASAATEHLNGNRVSASQAASEAIDAIIGHPKRFTFGIGNLDSVLKGIFPGRLYIWAGYQGTGKSAYMIQNCRKNAEEGTKVMMVSLEMSPAQVWLRMACGDLGIDLDSVLAGDVSPDTRSEVVDLAGQLGDMYESTIVIYPSPMSLMDIQSAWKMERPEMLWIDHSRLISGKPKEMNPLDWAGYIPLFLRSQICSKGGSVHMLQQLSRAANKDNRKPNMHDLRMAGEDDPDMITLMHRVEEPNMSISNAVIEFLTDKNRFGWTGETRTLFDLPHQRFLNAITDTKKFK